MRISTALRAALVLLLACPVVCVGWGRDGHSIIAANAAHDLSPASIAAVEELLGGRTLVDVCVWADGLRSNRRYKWASPLHYANVKPGDNRFVLERDCPAEGCVVSAILRFAKVLSDTKAKAADRTEALKFLVHFVGDIHQPMHVSYARDRGGNDVKVEFFHDRTNLHRVWDSGLIRHTKKSWRSYARELRWAITPAQRERWRSVDPALWATESHELAVNRAHDIPKSGKLGQAYFDSSIPIVNERLSMAGVRLAELLNRIFGGQHESGTPSGNVGTTPDRAGAPSIPAR